MRAGGQSTARTRRLPTKRKTPHEATPEIPRGLRGDSGGPLRRLPRAFSHGLPSLPPDLGRGCRRRDADRFRGGGDRLPRNAGLALRNRSRRAFRRRNARLCDHRRSRRARIAVCRRLPHRFWRTQQPTCSPFPNSRASTCFPFVAYDLSQSYDPSSGLAAVRELQTKEGSVEVPPDKLPMLVRFRNVNDGNTIEELDPRDLAAAYGPGVRLARAQFEFTTDLVTPMPAIWPKWLASEEQRGFGFSYQHLWSSSPISINAFKRG